MVKRSYLGFILVILATLSYAISSILLKAVESELSHGLVVFYRFFFALLLLLPAFCIRKSVSLKTKNLKLMLLRGTTGFLMIFCWTYALKFLPTANVILLSDTAPLFVPLILFFLWKQKITFSQGLSITIGFLGVLFILHPGEQLWVSFPALIGLCSGLLLAIGLVVIKQLSHSEPSIRIVTYFYIIGVLYSIVFFKLHIENITFHDYLFLIGIAISTTCYQILITKSLCYLSSSVVSPLLYLAVVFGCIGDYLFWHITPERLTFIGFVLIIVSALLNMYYHNKSIANN